MLMNINKHPVVSSGHMTYNDKQKYLYGEAQVLFSRKYK